MSVDKRDNVPNLARTPLERRLLEEKSRQDEREAILGKQHDDSTPGSDMRLPGNQRTNLAAPSATVKDKIYLFPESFNALRKELEDYFPHFMYMAEPATGKTLGWLMAFDAPAFITAMNIALDMEEQHDTADVSGICHRYLNKLRSLRGLSPIRQ